MLKGFLNLFRSASSNNATPTPAELEALGVPPGGDIERVEYQKLNTGGTCYRIHYKRPDGADTPRLSIMTLPPGVQMPFPAHTPMTPATILDFDAYESRLQQQKTLVASDEDRARSDQMRRRLLQRINRNGPLDGPGVLSPLVSLEEFFDGNLEIGSFGANLTPTPLPQEFYDAFRAIRERANVADVLVQVTQIEDPDGWPYSDTVWVITSAPLDDVRSWLTDEYLAPDDVLEDFHEHGAEPYEMPTGMRAFGLWWD